MIDITNYARFIELKKFSMITESINEATEDRLAQLKSGKVGGKFASYWKVVEDSIVKQVNAGALSGQAKVDYAAGGTMITVNWTVDPTSGKVTMTDASKPTATTAVTANPKLDPIVDKFGEAVCGMSEDEDAIYAVFRDDIKTDAYLQAFIKYWDSKKYIISNSSWAYTKTNTQKATDGAGYTSTVAQVLHKYLNTAELNAVNGYISAYSKFRF